MSYRVWTDSASFGGLGFRHVIGFRQVLGSGQIPQVLGL